MLLFLLYIGVTKKLDANWEFMCTKNVQNHMVMFGGFVIVYSSATVGSVSVNSQRTIYYGFQLHLKSTLWQSQVEIEHYFVPYFDYNTALEAL